MIEREIEYIGSKDTTIMGSRSGLAPLFLWHALSTRGSHFKDEVKTCQENAQYLHQRLGEIDYSSMLNEFSTTVVLSKPDFDVCHKWQLATEETLAHVVVMQNVTCQKINACVKDLYQGDRDEQDFVSASYGTWA